MSKFSAFLAQNKITAGNTKFVVSKNFIDPETNKPIEWELRSLSEEENEGIKRACMIQKQVKNGVYTKDVDPIKFNSKVITSSVVFPDLNDQELQDSYHVVGAESLLKKMLSMGEYARLFEKVQEINDFDVSFADKVEEAKN